MATKDVKATDTVDTTTPPPAPAPSLGNAKGEMFALKMDGSLLRVSVAVDGEWIEAAEFNMAGRNAPAVITLKDLGL